MRRLLLLILALVVLSARWACGTQASTPGDVVAIAQGIDGSYTITTPEYTAQLTNGCLRSLRINDIEFLDPHGPATAFYKDAPIFLPKVTQDADSLTATDGIHTARYDFNPGFLTITLSHTDPHGAAFVTVCNRAVAYVEQQGTDELAAAPTDSNWPDVNVIMPTGECLRMTGGSRIWGHALGQQVWELRDIAPAAGAPKKGYVLTLAPSREAPPHPTLAQLTQLSVGLPNDIMEVAAGTSTDLLVEFENNSNQPITSQTALVVTPTYGDPILQNTKPLVCAAHQTTTLTWNVKPIAPDFYTATVSIRLDNGAPKTATCSFGYDIGHIALTVRRPADFARYWAQVVSDAPAGQARIDITPNASASTQTVAVSIFRMVAGGQTTFGWLATPKYPGRYPVLLVLPSDHSIAVRPNDKLADEGFCVLSVEPTGQFVDKETEPLVQRAFTSPLDPAKFGLRDVMVRYLQLLDIVAAGQIPGADPDRIAVTGVGLGGSMALMLGALDDDIQAVAADVPSYCYIDAGSDQPAWPYPVLIPYLRANLKDQTGVLMTLRSYDVANFADGINCPVLISVGVDDLYSRPETIYALYNILPGPKDLRLYHAGHEGGGAEHWQVKMTWLKEVLGAPALAPASAQPGADTGQNAAGG